MAVLRKVRRARPAQSWNRLGPAAAAPVVCALQWIRFRFYSSASEVIISRFMTGSLPLVSWVLPCSKTKKPFLPHSHSSALLPPPPLFPIYTSSLYICPYPRITIIQTRGTFSENIIFHYIIKLQCLFRDYDNS